MKKIIAGLSLSLLCASNVFADCDADLKIFNDSKTFILENAVEAAAISTELTTAINNQITIKNGTLFDGTVTRLDSMSTKLKQNRDALRDARSRYQAAQCGKAAAAAAATAAKGK